MKKKGNNHSYYSLSRRLLAKIPYFSSSLSPKSLLKQDKKLWLAIANYQLTDALDFLELQGFEVESALDCLKAIQGQGGESC